MATAAVLWPALAMSAPIAASAGPGPGTTSPYNLAGTGWVIDDGSFPSMAPGLQEVDYDAGSGPWHIKLAGGGGGDFAASDTGSGALMVFTVSEFITIGGTESWTGWHEEIVQPGWRWQDDRGASGEPTFTYASGAPIPGLSITFTDPVFPIGGKIDFTFDPLPPGTNIKIVKRLQFEGLDPLLPGDTFLGTLDLNQFPVIPEPGSLILAIAAAAVVTSALVAKRCR